MSYALARSYQTQALMSASPAELVAMLYERAIHLLRETEQAIQEGRIEARHTANAKAIDVIHHLDMTLDRSQGGEIADRLGQLYGFILRRLADVDRLNDAAIPREMIGLLEPLRESWQTLARQNTPMPRAAAPGPAQAQAPQAQSQASSPQPAKPVSSTPAPAAPQRSSVSFSA
jgi:flagellar protein FliS